MEPGQMIEQFLTVGDQIEALQASLTAKVPVEPPQARQALVWDADVGNCPIRVTVGLYGDGKPSDVTLVPRGPSTGGMTFGLCVALGETISLCLRYGVPLAAITDKLQWHLFEPNGPTGDPDVPMARSIPDYLAKRLAATFLAAL